ncbi:MAG: hypothetical protein Q7T03_09880 [Deltaproteobacteria bacterium]|nr:hypothetical protein [Deltaproteobacteria bacterium]
MGDQRIIPGITTCAFDRHYPPYNTHYRISGNPPYSEKLAQWDETYVLEEVKGSKIYRTTFERTLHAGSKNPTSPITISPSAVDFSDDYELFIDAFSDGAFASFSTGPTITTNPTSRAGRKKHEAIEKGLECAIEHMAGYYAMRLSEAEFVFPEGLEKSKSFVANPGEPANTAQVITWSNPVVEAALAWDRNTTHNTPRPFVPFDISSITVEDADSDGRADYLTVRLTAGGDVVNMDARRNTHTEGALRLFDAFFKDFTPTQYNYYAANTQDVEVNERKECISKGAPLFTAKTLGKLHTLLAEEDGCITRIDHYNQGDLLLTIKPNS